MLKTPRCYQAQRPLRERAKVQRSQVDRVLARESPDPPDNAPVAHGKRKDRMCAYMGGSTTLSEIAPNTLPAGAELGKYRIVRLLGAGGMGAVYEATHKEIGKHVAIKVLSPVVAAIPGARERFLREARLSSRMSHPNIVNVTDTGNDGDRTYLVMELFRGEDLAQRIARQGRLAPRDAVDILLPVCSAVVAAHDAGVTHRDLKPSNIFLAETGHGLEPKILDFGISKSMDAGLKPEALTGTGSVVGTPFYLAPEQVVDNRSAGPASDQYALGVILYECLTGIRPYQHDSLYIVFNEIVAGTALSPRSHCPDIPSELEQIVARAMHVDAGRRYPTVKDLGWELLTFASHRVLSIWQDAFRTETHLPPDPLATPPPVSGAIRAVPATRILTPSVGGGPLGGSGPVGLAGGTQIAAPLSDAEIRGLKPMGRVNRAPGPSVEVTFDDTPAPAVAFLDPAPRRWVPMAMVIALLACGGVGWWIWNDQSQEAAKRKIHAKKFLNLADTAGGNSGNAVPQKADREADTFPLFVIAQPNTALIELDGRVVGRGRLERLLPKDHTLHRLRITAEGHTPELVEFSDTPPPKEIVLTALPASTTANRAGDQVRRGATADVTRPGRSSRARPKGSRPVDHGSGPSANPPETPTRREINPNGAPIID